MKTVLLSTVAFCFLALAACTETTTTESNQISEVASDEVVRASFNEDGTLNRAEGWREWVFVGAPLTPNALNDPGVSLPEFHNVYIEPSAFAVFSATGEFPEGTQFATELVLVRENNNAEDGSTQEVSGRGYFEGEYTGFQMSIKDSERFPDEPGNWAYFHFGVQPEPYLETAPMAPTASCNSCHEPNADTDFVFTQFYPVLRAVMNEGE